MSRPLPTTPAWVDKAIADIADLLALPRTRHRCRQLSGAYRGLAVWYRCVLDGSHDPAVWHFASRAEQDALADAEEWADRAAQKYVQPVWSTVGRPGKQRHQGGDR